MKEIIINNKKFIILYSILILISIAIIIFTFNNYKYYDKTIARITSTNEEYIDTKILAYGYKDDYYKQDLELIILNGSHKGETINIENEYYKSETFSQKYNTNDEVFVYLNFKDNEIYNAYLDGYKRDKYIVILVISFILIIVLIGKLKGLLSIFSLIINIVLFCCLAFINTKGISLVLLSYIGAILFSSICLTLVSGFNKKTLSAIISCFISVTITSLIALLAIKLTDYSGVRIEQMELLTRPFDQVLISEIILGGLGAIMDVSISISSLIDELIHKNKRITIKSLKKSGFNLGKDIIGTMINVLFFTYVCSAIPNLIIYFRNGIELKHLLHEYISLELTRALTGAIGITLATPIAIYITLLIYKRRVK